MPHAIRVHECGGADALRWEAMDVGDPGPGEVRVRHSAVGLNFIDIYHRTGLYPLPRPFVPGLEAAGVVEALGDAVEGLEVGDRVAYGAGPLGAYSQERVIPAQRLVRIPPGVDERTAAAMMLQGMTVEYLLRRTYRVQAGDTILMHAAAGGVGLIACQWAKHLGATVIGTVGSDKKAELARTHGCDHPVVYTRESFVARVKELTGGRGVPGGLRLGGTGHLPRFAGVPAAPRHDGELRAVVGLGSPDRPGSAQREGLGLSHPPHPHALRRLPHGARERRHRTF